MLCTSRIDHAVRRAAQWQRPISAASSTCIPLGGARRSCTHGATLTGLQPRLDVVPLYRSVGGTSIGADRCRFCSTEGGPCAPGAMTPSSADMHADRAHGFARVQCTLMQLRQLATLPSNTLMQRSRAGTQGANSMRVRKRLRTMWADGFITTLRRMCGSAPRDRPSLQLERSVSLGSQLASYRVRNVEQRREAYRNSLLGACLASLCSDIARLSDNLPRLPPDLQQAVLDALISCGQLTDETVRLFRGLSVFELGLGKPPYPGVTEAWLPVFSSAQLVAVDVSGCSAVSPAPACMTVNSRHLVLARSGGASNLVGRLEVPTRTPI